MEPSLVSKSASAKAAAAASEPQSAAPSAPSGLTPEQIAARDAARAEREAKREPEDVEHSLKDLQDWFGVGAQK